MKTYIFKATDSSSARGCNRTVTVYRMKNNKPVFVGVNQNISTASTYGDRGEAVRLIGKIVGHKNNNYKFESKSINLWEV